MEGGIPEEKLFFYLRPYWFYLTACYHEHKRLGVNSGVTIAISIVGQIRGISIAGHVFNAAANWFTVIIFWAPESLISALILSHLKPQISSLDKDVFQVHGLIFCKSADVFFPYNIYYNIYLI